jgi:two-component system cell cycle response regulator
MSNRNGKKGSPLPVRQPMDAKASTRFCVTPITPIDDDPGLTKPHSAYLIVVGGGLPGTMHPLDERGTSLGRSVENSVVLNDITVSRRHAFISIDSSGTIRISDDGSTNGTFLNGQPVPAHSSRQLDNGDRIQLGTSVLLKLVRLDASDERFQREMFERTVRDCLTGLYNRAYFIDQVGPLAERYSSQGLGMAILMIDIDHFKRVNDDHGHVAGDGVLKEVSAVIRESTRSEDLVARYGGEEFVVALPVSCLELALERAERIRQNLAERAVWTDSAQVRVTASIGLAFGPPGRPRHHDRTLILRADQALYKAKAEGRNRVIFSHPDLLTANGKTESAEFLSAG